MKKSLRDVFMLAGIGLLVCLGLLLVSIWRLGTAEGQSTEAQARRLISLQLADELRQSSDDLTRLARTFVVSGEPKWEQQYFEVLDIRNGKKPRPAGYEKIYWDFRAAGSEPSHTGQAVTRPLLDLMKSAGYTDAEFAKLKEAAANSDDLVKTETVAMNLVKGLRDDGRGSFTVQGEPDKARAAAMMHDLAYHQYKAKIMKPVDEFLVMLDGRTTAEVATASSAARLWFSLLVAAAVGMGLICIAGLSLIYRWLRRQLGAEPADVLVSIQAMAEGRLAQPRLAEAQVQGSVMAALAAMSARLGATVRAVRDNADGVATASAQIAQGNQDLSGRTEQQASSLQQTAATMNQLGQTLMASADNARQASQLAVAASGVAEKGGEVVGRVVETMRDINDSSRKIGDIISVIDSIAFQTNILALNAAVEAARAGEQGRGFAVVAGEVRTLAQRSAEAAREIKSLITASVERVEIGTTLVGQAGQTMDEIVASIRRVTDIVAEISSATGEQAGGVGQVGQAVAQMDQTTQQNAALVEESAAAAESLRQQAQQLVQAMAVFQVARS